MNKISREIKIKKIKAFSGSIVSYALGSLAVFAESLDAIVFSKKDAYEILNRNFGGSWTRTKSSKVLHNLRRDGYLEIESGSAGSIKFTSKGKLKILDQISNNLPLDGRYCFVSFDIPEDLRVRRDSFRRAIKGIGFKQIQRSLWVSNKNAAELENLQPKNIELSLT